MSHPLTPEAVAQTVDALHQSATLRGLRPRKAYTIRDMDIAFKAADMLTALAAENAALRTDLAETEALEMQHGAVIERLMAELTTLRASEAAAREALTDIAEPRRLASNGDPTVLRDRARAALDAAEGRVTVKPDETEAVEKVLATYRTLIGETPALISVLYDADLLPEQIVSMRGAISMAAVVEGYSAGSALTAPSDKIAEAARVLLDGYHNLGGTGVVYCAFDEADVYPPDAEIALRALAGKGE